MLYIQTTTSTTDHSYVTSYIPAGSPRLTVLDLHLPAGHWHDAQWTNDEQYRLVRAVLDDDWTGQFASPILWFYEPTIANAFIGRTGECAIVYDRMDRNSLGTRSRVDFAERERALLDRADVVLCGNATLCRDSDGARSCSHLIRSGVDHEHFAQALSPEIPIASEIAALAPPVLGYFGSVDRRLDLTLIVLLAERRPAWNIVVVGPIAPGIADALPQRPNLHWLGARSYAQLPGIAKGLSVCLLPFVTDAGTSNLNPAKTLEYLAAGRPVVSTALTEVNANFGEVVRVARSTEEFIQLCERETNSPSRNRIRDGIALAARHTWESIVTEIGRLLDQAVAAHHSLTQQRKENNNTFTTGFDDSSFVHQG